jgi:hypothetical protein
VPSDTGEEKAVNDDSIRWAGVRRLTFVPFLHDGRCALVPVGDRLVLLAGEVLAGEDPMLDTGLRVPGATFTQHTPMSPRHTFASSHSTTYPDAWHRLDRTSREGDRGRRSHRACGVVAQRTTVGP